MVSKIEKSHLQEVTTTFFPRNGSLGTWAGQAFCKPVQVWYIVTEAIPKLSCTPDPHMNRAEHVLTFPGDWRVHNRRLRNTNKTVECSIAEQLARCSVPTAPLHLAAHREKRSGVPQRPPESTFSAAGCPACKEAMRINPWPSDKTHLIFAEVTINHTRIGLS